MKLLIQKLDNKTFSNKDQTNKKQIKIILLTIIQ